MMEHNQCEDSTKRGARSAVHLGERQIMELKHCVSNKLSLSESE